MRPAVRSESISSDIEDSSGFWTWRRVCKNSQRTELARSISPEGPENPEISYLVKVVSREKQETESSRTVCRLKASPDLFLLEYEKIHDLGILLISSLPPLVT